MSNKNQPYEKVTLKILKNQVIGIQTFPNSRQMFYQKVCWLNVNNSGNKPGISDYFIQNAMQ